MDRRALPIRDVVCAFALALMPAAHLSADESELLTVEAPTTLTESFNSEFETLGGHTCEKCDCVRSACCCGYYVDWSKVPENIRPMPRPGNFPVPRKGCGYYSLCDQLIGVYRDTPPRP